MLQQEIKKEETQKQSLETSPRRIVTPAVNVYETTNETKIVLDMPGVDEKSVDISYEKEILTIEGKNSFYIPEDYASSYVEFKTGDYIRKFNINKPIDLEKSKAVMKNGKLTLTLAKIQPTTRKIEVKLED